MVKHEKYCPWHANRRDLGILGDRLQPKINKNGAPVRNMSSSAAAHCVIMAQRNKLYRGLDTSFVDN